MDALLAMLPAYAWAMIHVAAERGREAAISTLRAVLAQCDRIPTLAAVLGILLFIGLTTFIRALREGIRFGEPVAVRLALGGAMAGAAVAGLRPYILGL